MIGYLGEKIKNYVEQAYPTIEKTFVTQEERLGSAHALWVAREHFKDASEVFIFFGDVIVDADFRAIVDHPASCLGAKKVNDPWSYGIIEIDKNNIAQRVVEKPKIPKSDMAMVGIYKIQDVTKTINM